MKYELPNHKQSSHNKKLYTAGEVIDYSVETIRPLLDRIYELELQLSRIPDAWMTVQRAKDTKYILGMSKLVKTKRDAEFCLKQWQDMLPGGDELLSEFAVVGVHIIKTP